MRRLMCTFVVRIWHKTRFHMTWPIWSLRDAFFCKTNKIVQGNVDCSKHAEQCKACFLGRSSAFQFARSHVTDRIARWRRTDRCDMVSFHFHGFVLLFSVFTWNYRRVLGTFADPKQRNCLINLFIYFSIYLSIYLSIPNDRVLYRSFTALFQAIPKK